MATSLRTLGQALKRLGNVEAKVQLQQQRHASDMYYKPNKHIEAWSKRREDFEYEFQWDRPSTRSVLMLGIVTPMALYHFICYTGHLEDQWAGRTSRDFLWSQGARQQEQQ